MGERHVLPVQTTRMSMRRSGELYAEFAVVSQSTVA
jgi:hypothetical protein